jgi:glycosyltransferase involved in cell wall biosynthesis
MVKLGVDYPNISVIHCGIDPDRYKIESQPKELRQKHSIDADARVIGVVGNVKYWKGQETIVRAMGFLKDEFPDVKCILVGGTADSDMDYLNRQKRLCSELGIEDSVIFAGFQKNAIDYMNMMDIVVHTSVDPEPFGIVTLEALSLSKPYISTTVGGPAEVIENGKSGLLVDPGKPDMLAEAIRTFLADPDYARQCGENGNQRLLSDFTFEKNLSQTVAVYESILDYH